MCVSLTSLLDAEARQPFDMIYRPTDRLRATHSVPSRILAAAATADRIALSLQGLRKPLFHLGLCRRSAKAIGQQRRSECKEEKCSGVGWLEGRRSRRAKVVKKGRLVFPLFRRRSSLVFYQFLSSSVSLVYVCNLEQSSLP